MIKSRLSLFLLGAAALSLHATAADSPRIEDLQAQAAKFNAILTIPTFETTTEAVTKSADAALSEADAALDAIGKLPLKQLSFANTIGALDAIGYKVGTVANRLTLIRETSPRRRGAGCRREGRDANREMVDWSGLSRGRIQVGAGLREVEAETAGRTDATARARAA